MNVDQIIAGARVRLDADGRPIVDTATCGSCGRTWNDAAVSELTPTPAGRCPWEYDHDPEPPAPAARFWIHRGESAWYVAYAADPMVGGFGIASTDGWNGTDALARLPESLRPDAGIYAAYSSDARAMAAADALNLAGPGRFPIDANGDPR